MRKIEKDYIRDIEENRQEHYESGQKALEYITGSTAKYHGRCVRTLYVPKMFTQEDVKTFRALINTLYGIFDKVIDRYLKHPSYRKLFGFDKRLEELILLEPLYRTKIPVARIDIFYNEMTGDFKFCEFNTDGTSAMNEDRELNIALKRTKAYEQFAKEHRLETFELFDSLAEELLRIYRETKEAKEKPHVVIADFMDCATENEFRVVQNSLEKAGCTAEICEIRDLTFDGEVLRTPGGNAIDFIYRRAVTCDIMEHYDKVQPFLQAVKGRKVCLLGDFRTQIVHNKLFYKIVQMPETLGFLTEEEQQFVHRHFPYTISTFDESLPVQDVLEHQNKWILKPEDSYGSKGVYAGVEYDYDKWQEVVPTVLSQPYILQEFCQPYESVNIDLMKEKDAQFRNYSNITGLYVYGGQFHGIYSRIAQCSVISTQYSEMALATMVVEV